MKEHQDRLLQIPLGTESLFLDEAYRHREISYTLHRLFASWGYLPVETPVFDFFDTYRPLLSSNKKQIYRLIDREGDLLMLRSDITLFLAKQMGLILRREDLPARVCYGDTILRHQNREDINRNEFFQIGAELIGKEGVQGDLELLLLLQESFSTLKLKPLTHIGSRALVEALFAALPEQERNVAIEDVRNRNRMATQKQLNGLYSPAIAEHYDTLLSFIGNKKEFDKLQKRLTLSEQDPASPALSEIASIFSVLEELQLDEDYRIDFSEVGEQPYYTGMVFQSYIDGLDSAVASGGRYDKLLASFGFDAPSVGFSLMLRKLEPLLKEQYNIAGKIATTGESDFIRSYKEAKRRRDQGEWLTL